MKISDLVRLLETIRKMEGDLETTMSTRLEIASSRSPRWKSGNVKCGCFVEVDDDGIVRVEEMEVSMKMDCGYIVVTDASTGKVLKTYNVMEPTVAEALELIEYERRCGALSAFARMARMRIEELEKRLEAAKKLTTLLLMVLKS